MSRKINQSIIFLLLLVPALATAQKKESVLWKITGNNLPSASYLFGTFHTVSFQLIDSFPQLKNIINNCKYGVFEKSENTIGNVEYADIKTPPLDAIFTAHEYALVDSFFTKSPFGSIKPHNNDASLMAMLQAVVMLNEEETKNQAMFFDEYIHTYMEDSLKRNTFGLDEPVEMAESAQKYDYKTAAKTLVYLIETKVNVNRLINIKTLDEALYKKSMQADMALNEEPKEEWIREGTIKRNQIWLPKIISKTKEGSCFIAVGLGHLQYKTGLIALLRGKGYKVEPIRLNKIK